MSTMSRRVHENILRKKVWFDVMEIIWRDELNISNEYFTPFITNLYDNEVKNMMDEYENHGMQYTHKIKMLEKDIKNKINKFIDEHRNEGK